jgi:flavin reductase (NADH)
VSRRPVDARISTGREEDPDLGGAGLGAADFREALSHWASGVTIVAVRDGDDVHAITVSSLTSVSPDPPTVLVSLSSSARVLPFVETGTPLGISILADEQRGLASIYADSYPVGASPFGGDAAPLVEGALVGLTCRVSEMIELAGSHVVAATVEAARVGSRELPLLYYRRRYRALAE